MKTNAETYAGAMLYTWKEQSTVTGTTSGGHSFTVTPNPCHNGTGNFEAPSAYSFAKNDWKNPNGTSGRYYFLNYPNNTQLNSGHLTPIFGADPLLVHLTNPINSTMVDNKAMGKLYDKIKASGISLNTTVGEGRETYQLLRAVALSARRTLNNLKHAKRMAGRKGILGVKSLARNSGRAVSDGITALLANPLQTVGGLELAWAVGLKPLLEDVEALRAHVLSNVQPEVDLKFDARASGHADLKTGGFKTVGAVSRDETLQTSLWVEYGVTLRVSDIHAFENWRTGLTVRPTLLWELTTLSFVVDYFINMGQYLELLEASLMNNGLTFVNGYKTVGTSEIKTLRYQYYYRGYDYFDFYDWKSSGTNITKNRTVLTAFPVPQSVTIKIPTASGPLLVIAALLSQLISKR